MTDTGDNSDSDGPIIDNNVIRIQLRKPSHQKWELRTRNHSPSVKFPTIQLFDCEGNLLVETNDENISISSCDHHEANLRLTQSLREKDFRHFIEKVPLKKHNTISGGKIYTRIYRTPVNIANNKDNSNKSYIIKDSSSITNIPNNLTINNLSNLQQSSLDTTPFPSDGFSDISSYKSSDNETNDDTKQDFEKQNIDDPVKATETFDEPKFLETSLFNGKTNSDSDSDCTAETPEGDKKITDKETELNLGHYKSKSLTEATIGIPKRLKCSHQNLDDPIKVTDTFDECKFLQTSLINGWANTDSYSDSTVETPKGVKNLTDKENELNFGLYKSKSLTEATIGIPKRLQSENLAHSLSGTCMYDPPQNKVPFLSTYLKSLPRRTSSYPDWFVRPKKIKNPRNSLPPQQVLAKSSTEKAVKWKGETTDTDFTSINIPTDVAVDCEMKKRLKIYRRGLSEIEGRQRKLSVSKRRHSVSDVTGVNTSSSESVDEADLVLNRLKRRILKNKLREKRQAIGVKFLFNKRLSERPSTEGSESESRRDVVGGAPVRSRLAMGSNISQHSAKGLKGRRARSSGDLCNGDSKSNTESSVCGSVVGDVMGWNRSLPNHLDGNRHLAEYSRVNNNYAEFSTYRNHPKGGRGLRYRVSKSGSDAEPVWKLQDPGFDQGYGSERSPEDDYVPPIVPQVVSLEEYEAELRAIYPFISEDNTFTVVVEKDVRGLGMSVMGGGGLVRIRRLYPPQPAWRTGRLAPKDLLLAANNVPLHNLTTYEALEVLRTAPARVELRVCRPPPDALESLTPPEPPTPPVRTPHPPHLPPLDPLNCHPMHQRLSQTTSSATTSSSEGRGRREHSPEVDRRDLHLPDLDRPLPVYNVQYGDDGSVEFDIMMTKVNGSLGFTLRKEDHSALGHYVRALVREPALSDGRIQPGDRIVAVNETPMSNMSHAEAVAFLRACGAEVRLRLYRDHAATPLSPMSPKEEPTDSDPPLMNRPKPPLRPEAVSMLCDLAARRLTPDAMDGSRSPCLSPRKFRRLTKENNHYETPNDGPKSLEKSERSGTPEAMRPQRALSVTLISPTAPTTSRKQKLSLTVPPHGYELNNLDNDALDAPNVYQEDISRQRYAEPVFPADSDEPVSMPADLSGDEARFKHANPAYQSAVLHTSTSDAASDGPRDDNNALKKWKWKGVALSPDSERKDLPAPPPPIPTHGPAFGQPKPKEVDNAQKENIKPKEQETKDEISTEPTILTVELNRGWNSRLGFSVQSHPESGQSYISAVYSDSVAARDGRLRKGDVILQVNDENVTSMKTPEVIDLLRILRGSICITVLRPPNKPEGK